MREGSPYARLDKTGQRILCGRIDCGRELAGVDEFDLFAATTGAAALIVTADGTTRSLGPDDQLRILRLSPGWVRPTESAPWQMTRHAWERVKRGKPPRYRRPYAELPGGARRQHPQGTALPCRITCPACGLEQVLDEDRLHLTHLPIQILPAGRLAFGEGDLRCK
jgi:hypothetical protein